MTTTVSSPAETTTRVVTSRFGELEIIEDKVITMTTPFLGFPNERLFALLPHGPDSAFWWLQSMENPNLAFVVIQPAMINPLYQPVIPASALQELKAPTRQEVELLLILTIPQGQPEAMTANLLGPVVLNASRKLAKQVLLDPAQYSPCWPVFQTEQQD